MIKTFQEDLFFLWLPKEERKLSSSVSIAILGRYEMCVHQICPLHAGIKQDTVFLSINRFLVFVILLTGNEYIQIDLLSSCHYSQL